MNAIELSHVTKHFPGFTLQDLSLTVPSGTICGLVGENGAGKSTTIRLLMGALRPDSGTCTVLGADSAAPEFLSLKEDIGVVLDEAYFPESLNALQVGGVMAKTYRRWDGKQYQNYLTRFGLPEKKPFKDFSRGMKMKLAIAVALSHSPRLLVLDEATAGLDPIVRDEVLEIFNEFTREEDHSILISSHILSDLEKLCDYILPPPGAAAVLRREGSAAGGVWHLRGHGRSSEQPSGRGRGSPGEQQLRRRPVPGEAGAGACGLGAGAAHGGGYRPVFGERSEGAMSALLLKDYYVIFRQMKIFLLLILVFSCIPGTFYSTFAVVYASMLPYTALAYDERSRWDQMAAMMPYSARDVVLSKYLFGWIAVAVSAAATFVLQTILSVIWLSDVEGPSIPVILLSVCVAVCILDITLPMMFRFGVEKGRLAMFLIIFLVCASAGGIATIEQSSLDGGFYLSLSLVPAAIAAVVLTVVSIPLAIRFYGRRSR
jgi:ABC-type Na+ transport system ATPase subunit NatA